MKLFKLILALILIVNTIQDTCSCSKKVSYSECGTDSNSRSGCHWVPYPSPGWCGVDGKSSECCETRNYRRCAIRYSDGSLKCPDFVVDFEEAAECEKKITFLE